MAFYIVER